MGDTSISWTQMTWNPLAGCSLKSPGCTNCYAMSQANRIQRMRNGKPSHYDGTTKVVNGHPVWTGKINLAPDHILLAPLKRRTPTVYFVNSMSDLFHDDVPDQWIDRVFAVMALCPQHTFQVLTKRSKRMRDYMQLRAGMFGRSYDMDFENVWLGVSCEDQQRANERIPDLLKTPAAHRFVSAEPLLGPIDFTEIDIDGETMVTPLAKRIDWIISGGESGPGFRPTDIAWHEDIMRQCRAAGVLYHFKQDSALRPGKRGRASDELWACKDVPGGQ